MEIVPVPFQNHPEKVSVMLVRKTKSTACKHKDFAMCLPTVKAGLCSGIVPDPILQENKRCTWLFSTSVGEKGCAWEHTRPGGGRFLL